MCRLPVRSPPVADPTLTSQHTKLPSQVRNQPRGIPPQYAHETSLLLRRNVPPVGCTGITGVREVERFSPAQPLAQLHGGPAPHGLAEDAGRRDGPCQQNRHLERREAEELGILNTRLRRGIGALLLMPSCSVKSHW